MCIRDSKKMVQMIADRFGLSSLKFNTLETLVEAIGLPKCKAVSYTHLDVYKRQLSMLIFPL